MALSPTALPDLLKDVPAGSWVAISEEREKVLAFGSELEAVVHDARHQGEVTPLILRKPSESLAMFL